MCYAIHHIHNKCRHYKKVEIIEDCGKVEEEPCILVPILFKYIKSPSLCVSCFREEEAKIDAVYNERVAQLEYALAMEKESRDREIQKFRSEQGVWGDG